MESIKIILLCMVSAVIYGNVQDQVTARVCVEYFTIGHPPIFATASPTLLAIGWGTIATWWAGLLVGIPVAIASRLGSWPKYRATNLIKPIFCLLVVMATASLAAGFAGYLTAKAGGVWLVEPLRSRVPESKHSAFLGDLWAHLAAYGFGFLGGFAICGWVVIRRRRLAGTIDGVSQPIDMVSS